MVLLTSINACGQARMILDTANRRPLRLMLCFHSPCQPGGPLRFYSLKVSFSLVVFRQVTGAGGRTGDCLPVFHVWEGLSSTQQAAPIQSGGMVIGKKQGAREKMQRYCSASYAVPASGAC